MCSVKNVFLERCSQISQEMSCIRDSILIKLHSWGYKKETLAQVFSCEFRKISKNTFFTEHLWMTACAFSFSKAATGSALWKKMFLKILQNSQENPFDLWNFQKHLFYRTPLNDCFWLFRAMLLNWGTANNVWKNSDEYSLPRNTNFGSTVLVYDFFLGSINFQCMFSLVYTVCCQKQPSEYSVKERCS